MAVNSLLVEETDEWAEKEVERELACMTEEDLVRDDEELFPENHPDKTGANVSVFASLYEKVVERRSEFLHETSRFIDGTKQETRQALFGMNPAVTVDVAEQRSSTEVCNEGDTHFHSNVATSEIELKTPPVLPTPSPEYHSELTADDEKYQQLDVKQEKVLMLGGRGL
jgi:hypothetical protein